MIKIGYLLICENIAYNKEENIQYLKNPLDAVMLDAVPYEYSFYMLSSLFNVNEAMEYIIEVDIFNPKGENVSELNVPIVFDSKPPEGKRSTGVITLNIHHKKFKFKDTGIYRLFFKISDKETGESSSKELEFPVILKRKSDIVGDEDEG